MRKLTWVLLAVLGVLLAVLLLPRLLARSSTPAQTQTGVPQTGGKGKKTIVGKLFEGGAQLGNQLGGSGSKVAGWLTFANEFIH